MILFINCCTIEVRKKTNIRKREIQVPHMTQDTTWESNEKTVKITKRIQEVSQRPNQSTDNCQRFRQNVSLPKQLSQLNRT